MTHDRKLSAETGPSHADPLVEAAWSALTTVIDPEIGLDIVTLGLVYDVAVDGMNAVITHTLTTPGCPMEKIITDGIHGAVSLVDGIETIATRLVWDPAWHSGMIDPEAWRG